MKQDEKRGDGRRCEGKGEESSEKDKAAVRGWKAWKVQEKEEKKRESNAGKGRCRGREQHSNTGRWRRGRKEEVRLRGSVKPQ